MKKKSVIILCSVVAVCAIGLIASHYVDWHVDSDNASGDIGKASRFSREMTSEDLTNMEELLQNDSAFKDGIVAAQVVMQTRAVQFGALVDLSNEVAGNIPAFAEVLKDMNATLEMVNNVSTSLTESGNKLNAALSGEECPDLAQSTINASLAYTTLQKQNKLADRFIEATDKYLETAQGDDNLKFVRDQWLEYQQMTAALDGDQASAEALAKKGNLLTGEKALSCVSNLPLGYQVPILTSCHVVKSMNVDTQLSSALVLDNLAQVVKVFCSASEITMQSMASKGDALQNHEIEKIFRNAVTEIVKNSSNEVVSRILVMSNAQELASAQKLHNAQGLANAQKLHNAQGLANTQRILSVMKMSSVSKVMDAYSTAMNNRIFNPVMSQSQKIDLGNRVGEIINQTVTAGNNAKFDLRVPK